MKQVFLYSFLVLTLLPSVKVAAQSAHSQLYMTGRLLAANDPALSSEKQYFSLFPASAQSLGIYVPFKGKHTFRLNENGSNSLFDFESMNKKAAKNNPLFIKLNSTLISFSSQYRDMSWQISLQEEATGSVSFDRGLIALISKGNVEERAAEFSIPLAGLHFRSYNFSVTKSVNEKLRAGVNLKVIFGKSLVDVDSRYRIITSNDNRSIELSVAGKGRVSAPVSLDQLIGQNSTATNWNSYLFGNGNPGLALDASVHYQPDPKSLFTVVFNNVGMIYWKRNITTFRANGSYNWKGVEMSGPLGFESLGDFARHPDVEAFRDSFLNRILEPEVSSSLAMLPVSASTAYWHRYERNLILGLFAESMLLKQFVRFNAGFTAIYQRNDYWSFSSGIHVSNRGITQFPLGIAYRGDGMKASFVIQNLLHPLFPSRVRGGGGAFNLAFVLNRLKMKGSVNSKAYPFYRKF